MLMSFPLRPLPIGSDLLDEFDTMPKKADLQRFLALLLKASLRLDAITKKLTPRLSTIESYVLSGIADSPECVASDLTVLLSVSKSALSKTLKHLSERGLVVIEGGARDKRRKLLHLSELGKEAWEEDTDRKNKQMEEFVRPLSTKEQGELLRYLRQFADASSARDVSSLHGDHPFRSQIIRLTQALGFLGEDLLESGVDSYRVQILNFCGTFPLGVPFREVDESIPYDKSVISRIITDFEGRTLITKSHQALDRRTVEVVLTAKGWEERARIIEKCCATLRRYLKKLSPEFLGGILPLLEKTVERVVYVDFSNSGPKFDFAKSTRDRRIARGEAIKLIAQQNLQHEISPYSLSFGNIFYTISRSGDPVGVVEIRRRGTQGEILLWIFNPLSLSDKEALNLLSGIKEHAKTRFDLTNFISSWRPLVEAVKGSEAVRHGGVPVSINI